ncbi:MAG: DUF3558 domain-containing protein, partial [Mycobacterium sp.]
MSRRSVRAVVAVLITALVVMTGCSRSVGGTAVKAGGPTRNNNSQQQYPN